VTADSDGPEADDGEMTAQMDGDEDHVMEGQSLEREEDGPSFDTTASRTRSAALRGNPVLNSVSESQVPENNKRSNVRAALGATKGLALHSFYGSR
jgi:hypothetical protein